MKILFITRPFITEPLGILYLSAVAKDIGHEVDLVLTSDDYEKKMTDFQPDVVGYSVMTGNQNFYMKLNLELKKKYDFVAAFGGSHPTFFPKMVKHPGVDTICRGEGETAFLELLEKLENGKNITRIANITVNKESFAKTSRGAVCSKDKPTQIIPTCGSDDFNKVRPFLEIDDIPIPDRSIISFKKNLPIKHFIATRGCPYDCSYCFNKMYYDLYKETTGDKNKRIRIRDHVLLVDEIEAAIKESDSETKLVYFLDDVFALDKHWLPKFGEEYTRRIGIKFHCHVRPNSLTPDRAEALAKAGCNSVSMALESGNDRLRNQILNRNLPKSKIIESVRLLQKNGIKLKLQSMIGLPTGSLKEDLETLEMNIELQPDYAWVSILQPYPGTQLGEYCVSEGWYKGDFSDLESNFFDTSLLEFDDEYKSQLANLQKLFAVVVKNPKMYDTSKFWEMINATRTPKENCILRICIPPLESRLKKRCLDLKLRQNTNLTMKKLKKPPTELEKLRYPSGHPEGRVACFIPIKANSKRVPRKNFRKLGGIPLYQRVINAVIESSVFEKIFVDTDSNEIKEYAESVGISIIDRLPHLSSDDANGNDLLCHWHALHPDFDYYFQMHATAPFITAEVLKDCVTKFISSKEHDSVMTAVEDYTWFWYNDNPVNYDPKVLPRSQDAKPLIRETTALYGVSSYTLSSLQCRVGTKPMFYFVDQIQAIDIDNEVDLLIAQSIIDNNAY